MDEPKPPPPGKTAAQALGQRIGIGLCVMLGLLVAMGPGVQKGQRILGMLFALACAILLMWKVMRNR